MGIRVWVCGVRRDVSDLERGTTGRRWEGRRWRLRLDKPVGRVISTTSVAIRR